MICYLIYYYNILVIVLSCLYQTINPIVYKIQNKNKQLFVIIVYQLLNKNVQQNNIISESVHACSSTSYFINVISCYSCNNKKEITQAYAPWVSHHLTKT